MPVTGLRCLPTRPHNSMKSCFPDSYLKREEEHWDQEVCGHVNTTQAASLTAKPFHTHEKKHSHSLSLKWTGNHTLGSGASLSLLSTCLVLELPRRHTFDPVYRGCFQGGSNQGELTLKMGGPVTDRVCSPRLNSKGEKKKEKANGLPDCSAFWLQTQCPQLPHAPATSCLCAFPTTMDWVPS